MSAKPRRFQITLTGTVPKGMTVAQVRRAYWNGGFNGDNHPRYDTVSVDVDEFYEDGRSRRPMKVRLGRATLVKES